jgi:hypothetical protein
VALRLFLFAQELGIVEPVGGRAASVGERRIEFECVLARLGGSSDVGLFLLQISELD